MQGHVLKLNDHDLSSLVVRLSFHVQKLAGLKQGCAIAYLKSEALPMVAEAYDAETFRLTCAEQGSPEIITGPASIRDFELSSSIRVEIQMTGDWKTTQRQMGQNATFH